MGRLSKPKAPKPAEKEKVEESPMHAHAISSVKVTQKLTNAFVRCQGKNHCS